MSRMREERWEQDHMYFWLVVLKEWVNCKIFRITYYHWVKNIIEGGHKDK